MRDLERKVIAWILILMCLVPEIFGRIDCDRYISHKENSNKNGTFQSPSWPNMYPNSVRCIYKFIGKENERVKISFDRFDIQGISPTCEHDYLDIYAQLKSPDESILESPAVGRFCGDMLEDLPNVVISTNNVIILDFYADGEKNDRGFIGNYEFIDGGAYNMGTEAPPNVCGYTIRSENIPSGYIVSPTYPGMYPDNLFCYYKLQGKPGQRIKLTFNDFSLFYGGDYCPWDYLKIYDNYTNQGEVIGVFCGRYKNVTIFSTKEALHIEFITRSGRVFFDRHALESKADFKFDRQGFNISFEFSENFVKLDFINPDAHHIIGTECDQRIMSKKESNGTIASPLYPGDLPPNVVCRYFLDGLVDQQNLEKIKVTFNDFNIRGSMPHCVLGNLTVNLRGLNHADRVDDIFCGNLLPPPLISKEPRMVLTLNTPASVLGRGFLAKYEFVTDYAIPGVAISEGTCQFLYRSNTPRRSGKGQFNSPRHPGNYPINIDCTYIFFVAKGERLGIRFDSFALAKEDYSFRGDVKNFNLTNENRCKVSDYLEIYKEGPKRGNYTRMVRFCGDLFPGPIMSDTGIKILFHSNSKGVDLGFKARYEFVKQPDLNTECGSEIQISGGDFLVSPNYPQKYKANTVCEWTLKASSPDKRILLQFDEFNVEGHMENSGCPNAVLKVYEKEPYPRLEYCGSLKDESYATESDYMKLRFITSSKAMSAKGFKITYTEISPPDKVCDGFTCKHNGFCISSKLVCNNLPNCGTGDTSDESSACPVEPVPQTKRGPNSSGVQILHIAIGTSISSFFCIILLICGFYHRKRFRTVHKPPDNDHVEVRYITAATDCNTTDRLLNVDHAEDANESPRTCQKVSIV